MEQPAAPGRATLRAGIVQHRSSDSLDLDPFYDHVLAGLEETLDAHGASVLVLFEESAQAELDVYRRWAQDAIVDAVVLTDLVDGDERIGACRRVGLPAYALCPAPPADVPAVVVDDADAMRHAIGYLAGLGHAHVARVSGPPALLHTRARGVAFDEVVAARGLRGTTVVGDYGTASGADATRRLLDADPRPTAIVYDDDLMAVGGLRVARERGFDVPGDVSLLAWDDSAHCRLADPPLSAVSRDVRGLGAELGGLLLRAAADGAPAAGDAPDALLAPPARVVGRASTGPAPTRRDAGPRPRDGGPASDRAGSFRRAPSP